MAVNADFARTLERRLAASQRETATLLEVFRYANDELKKETTRLAALQRENATLWARLNGNPHIERCDTHHCSFEFFGYSGFDTNTGQAGEAWLCPACEIDRLQRENEGLREERDVVTTAGTIEHDLFQGELQKLRADLATKDAQIGGLTKERDGWEMNYEMMQGLNKAIVEDMDAATARAEAAESLVQTCRKALKALESAKESMDEAMREDDPREQLKEVDEAITEREAADQKCAEALADLPVAGVEGGEK